MNKTSFTLDVDKELKAGRLTTGLIDARKSRLEMLSLFDYKELEQEKDKQKELIDKIKKHCKEMITNNKYAYLSQVASETYKASGHNEVCEEILDLIKEYENND